MKEKTKKTIKGVVCVILAPLLAPFFLINCLTSKVFDPKKRKPETGRINEIKVRKKNARQFSDSGISLPALVGVADIAQLIPLSLPFIISLLPNTTDKFAHDFVWWVILILTGISILLVISLIIRGIKHVTSYHRWLVLFDDKVDNILKYEKEKDEERFITIVNLIVEGKTRDLLLGYPEVYLQLKLPHLWNSYSNTKRSIYCSILILVVLVALLFVFLQK